MKIAVTGASGRIGSAVVALALEHGHEVVAIDRAPAPATAPVATLDVDMRDFDALLDAVRESDALVHLAAITGPGRHPDHVVHNTNVVGSYNALRAAIAPLAGSEEFFAAVTVSGGHAESMAMVARGDADVCACDCVTFALWERCEPERTEGLRALALSPMAPSLPYITRAEADDDLIARLRAGLRAALEDPDLAAARQALLLCGMEVLPLDGYDRILDLEQDAVTRGYPELA